MSDVKVSRFPDLASAPASGFLSMPRDGRSLAMLEFSTSPAAGFLDFEQMVAAACDVATPLMLRLFADGFKLWLLRVDIERTPEMKKRWTYGDSAFNSKAELNALSP